ncbi:hypothetical protein HN451_02755 [archaeon]|jgi:hypothetical protein|nr:hypothetical protein [archaeon]
MSKIIQSENNENKPEIKQDENTIILNNFKSNIKKFFNIYNDKLLANLNPNDKISLLKNIIDIDNKILKLNKLIKKFNKQ